VSDDYRKGYSGQAKDSDTSEGEYQRGVDDRRAGRAASGMGAMDLSDVSAGSIVVARQWARNPNKTLREMILSLIVFSVGLGLIGFAGSLAFSAMLLRTGWTSGPALRPSSLGEGLASSPSSSSVS
jgi:hypothetical protein